MTRIRILRRAVEEFERWIERARAHNPRAAEALAEGVIATIERLARGEFEGTGGHFPIGRPSRPSMARSAIRDLLRAPARRTSRAADSPRSRARSRDESPCALLEREFWVAVAPRDRATRESRPELCVEYTLQEKIKDH